MNEMFLRSFESDGRRRLQRLGFDIVRRLMDLVVTSQKEQIQKREKGVCCKSKKILPNMADIAGFINGKGRAAGAVKTGLPKSALLALTSL